MALTQSFKDSLSGSASTGGVPQGTAMTPEQFQAWASPPSTSYSQQVSDTRQGAVDYMKSAADQANQATNPLDLARAGTRFGSGIASYVTAPVAPAFNATIGKAAGAVSDALSKTAPIKGYATDVENAPKGTFENNKPGIEGALSDTADLGNVTGTLAAGGDALRLAPKLGPVLNKALKTSAPAAAAVDTAKMADADIVNSYTKAIKPTIVAKTAPGQLEKYNTNVAGAVKNIVKNKESLQLVDSYGDPAGKLPETIDQFRQAIEQTKATIFKQYDTMAAQAGEAGAKVDLKPISQELQKVATNKIVQDLHPELADYALNRAKTLLARGDYSTSDAQAAVQNLNRSLDAFYRNPSYETASKASVDSLIANQMREALDKSIEQAGSPGYQDLRNQYASLKAIEKDVIKRGIVEARQTGGRGMNVGDIVSAEELIRGLATHNPAAMVTAGAIKGIQALRRYLTDPNRAVKQMFEKADQSQALGSPTGQAGSSPESSTVGDKVKDYLKNAQPGLSMKKVGPDPLSVAQKIGGEDIPLIQNFLDKPDSLDAYLKLQPLIEGEPGLKDMDPKTLQRFFTDVVQERNSPDFQQPSPKAEGAAPQTGEDRSVRDNGKFNGSQSTFKGFEDITSKVIDDLKGRAKVSKQYLLDATNRADWKQPEKDLVRNLLKEEPKDNIDAATFANKVKTELLPLKRSHVSGTENPMESASGRYENVTLPSELRGPVADYSEHIYESPIETSAAEVHFSSGNEVDYPNYFAHTRIEDLPADSYKAGEFAPAPGTKGGTRRVIELQSDLFQKGRLESEMPREESLRGAITRDSEIKYDKRAAEIAKLEPYRNTWHERIIREEVKQAAKDGKTKLQFPTGETAMKIEGLGNPHTFYLRNPDFNSENPDSLRDVNLTPENVKVGATVARQDGQDWIITDVLGDGKFKAVQKLQLRVLLEDNGVGTAKLKVDDQLSYVSHHLKDELENYQETFDISGKVDTNNPIYKFYEKEVGKYLQKKYGAKLITDPQGVKWYEMNVDKKMKNLPVEAFGAGAALLGSDNNN